MRRVLLVTVPKGRPVRQISRELTRALPKLLTASMLPCDLSKVTRLLSYLALAASMLLANRGRSQEPADEPARSAEFAAFMALLAGDSSDEPDALLRVPLDGADALLHAPALEEGAERPAPGSLQEAYVAYLQLDDEARSRLFKGAADRHRELQAAELIAAEQERARSRLERAKAQLEALLARQRVELDEGETLDALLTIDLRELAEARQVVEGEDHEGESAPTETGEPDEVRTLRAAVRALKLRYAALPADERQALRAHQQTLEEEASRAEAAAEAARQARAAALEEARAAETEVQRLLAEARAQLHGAEEAQANFAASLEEELAQADGTRERALTIARRVREFEGEGEGAIRLYGDVVAELRVQRAHLSTSLTAAQTPVETPMPAPLPELLEDDARVELAALRDGLEASGSALRRRAREERWEVATVRRDAVVSLNESRLALLPHLPSTEGITGFGSEGVAQAKRELDQIRLEGRYHLLALPRALSQYRNNLRRAPSQGLLNLLKVLMLLAAFRWWRARAKRTLDGLHRHYERRIPATAGSRGVASVLWYLQRVRGPIEWFVLFAAVFTFAADGAQLKEFDYVSILLTWTLVGSFVVRLLNALAERYSRRSSSAGALRLRSLRLVGLSVVVFGLLLAITRETVGRGTLYVWALAATWVLVFPLLLTLLIWWRPTILARSHASRDRALFAWASKHTSGPMSYVAATVAGIALFLRGIRRLLLSQATRLSSGGGLFSHLFRRELEQRAGEKPRAYAPLRKEEQAALDPGTPSVEHVNACDDALSYVREHIRPGGLVALVGEQGGGKTHAMKRMVDGTLFVPCPAERTIWQAIANAAGADDSSPEAVERALRDNEVHTVLIDDAHRLVRPVIGGLDDFDDFVSEASSLAIGWVLSFNTPAWNYLRRARSERAVFDGVSVLPRWSREAIGQLLELRCKAAGLELHYDDLATAKSADPDDVEDAIEGAKRDYLQLLWDYSVGNPSVALHFFADSLGRRGDRVHVHLFSAPSVETLDKLTPDTLFMLRAVAQLEEATNADIIECTDLHAADVADAMRIARGKGVVVADQGRSRLSLHWYRAIMTVLQRQHLLSTP